MPPVSLELATLNLKSITLPLSLCIPLSMVMVSIIKIHHECESGIKQICPKDHLLAARGLSSDDKR